MQWPRREVMRHMLAGRNLGLISPRQTVSSMSGLATRQVIGHKALAAYDINYLFPLYLYPSEGEQERGIGVRPNLDEGFIESVSEATGLTFQPDGPGDLESMFGPEDIFHYIYAILHSPAYRDRYADFLKSDFPRIPLTSSLDLFRQLITLGERVSGLHLMEKAPESQPTFPATGTMLVENVRFLEGARGDGGQVTINSGQHFEGVSKATWEFTIGGYRPAQKWLKDRKGRTLTADDVRHYRMMCGALAETQVLMGRIDDAITDAGGWPLA